MTFKEAFNLAMQVPKFAKHVERVNQAKSTGEDTPVILFSIGDESFYYGFDGVDLHKGKHSASRSKYLIGKGYTLVVKSERR